MSFDAIYYESIGKGHRDVQQQTRHVRLSVRMEQLGSQWTEFNEIRYLSFVFPKSLEKIQISLQSDKNNGYFTGRCFNIYDKISLSSF